MRKMSLTTAAAAAAITSGAAIAAYLDARYHIRHDLSRPNGKAYLERAMRHLEQKVREDKLTVYDALADRAAATTGEADNIFLVFEGRAWTYAQFYDAVRPVANWLMREVGVRRGEMVALDATNSPAQLLLWLGLEAIGASPAHINCNLTTEPLVHCVRVSGARHLLADVLVQKLVAPVERELAKAGVETVYFSETFLDNLRDDRPIPLERRRKLDPMGVASLIYTSGTTGKPKATVIPRFKVLNLIQGGQNGYLNLKPDDRMYTCLPLYHGSATALCVLPCIGSGATVVLSRKFSHKTFWPEVHDSGATHIQYVGELCRYLVNAPPSKLDRGHRVRMAWGNGMRPDVWDKFRERFGIETIHELYAATDGMGFSTNPNRGEFGRYAIGVRGLIWHLLHGADEKRVRVDPDTHEIVRDKDGWAIEVRVGEAGETIYRMDPKNAAAAAPVYFNDTEQAMAKRRVADVFQTGDLWFRSGDTMRLDGDGRLFFVDRLGDTFRWRSENVSTHEVADVVGAFPQIAEANVYGVLVPHADGRAGCAAIVPRPGVRTRSGEPGGAGEEPLDWRRLAAHCLARLPRYAVPLFVRVVREMEYTGTMKMQKGRLRGEGIDLEAIERRARENGEAADLLYWLPPGIKEYVPFTMADWRAVQGGKVRL